MSRKARGRRFRWLRRLALLAAVCATLLVVCAAYLSSDAFARRVRHVLIERGSEALGEDLHIQHLDLSLWPLGLDLRGIEVRSRDPLRPGQEILAIERVAVEQIRIGGLRHVDVARLRIERPVLRLRVGNGELRDFPGLRGGGGEGGGAPRRCSSNSWRSVTGWSRSPWTVRTSPCSSPASTPR